MIRSHAQYGHFKSLSAGSDAEQSRYEFVTPDLDGLADNGHLLRSSRLTIGPGSLGAHRSQAICPERPASSPRLLSVRPEDVLRWRLLCVSLCHLAICVAVFSESACLRYAGAPAQADACAKSCATPGAGWRRRRSAAPPLVVVLGSGRVDVPSSVILADRAQARSSGIACDEITEPGLLATSCCAKVLPEACSNACGGFDRILAAFESGHSRTIRQEVSLHSIAYLAVLCLSAVYTYTSSIQEESSVAG